VSATPADPPEHVDPTRTVPTSPLRGEGDEQQTRCDRIVQTASTTAPPENHDEDLRVVETVPDPWGCLLPRPAEDLRRDPAERADHAGAAGRGYAEPSPIQHEPIRSTMRGKDLVASPTGTGKTAAFDIPIIESLDPNDPRCRRSCGAHRELAMQWPARTAAGPLLGVRSWPSTVARP